VAGKVEWDESFVWEAAGKTGTERMEDGEWRMGKAGMVEAESATPEEQAEELDDW